MNMKEAILLAIAIVISMTSVALIVGAILGFRSFGAGRSRAEEIGECADALLTGGIVAAIRDVVVGWRRHPELQRLLLAGLLGGVVSVALFKLMLR